MSWGASGIKSAPKFLYRLYTVRTAWRRTYWWRCVKHCLMDATIGSNNSCSRSLHRKRSVQPRMYSLGWFKSLRIALLQASHKGKHQQINRRKSKPQTISQYAPHEDHFRLELAGRVVLLHNLPKVHQQLLDFVVLHGDAVPDHKHQQFGHVLAVQDHLDAFLDARNLA